MTRLGDHFRARDDRHQRFWLTGAYWQYQPKFAPHPFEPYRGCVWLRRLDFDTGLIGWCWSPYLAAPGGAPRDMSEACGSLYRMMGFADVAVLVPGDPIGPEAFWGLPDGARVEHVSSGFTGPLGPAIVKDGIRYRLWEAGDGYFGSMLEEPTQWWHYLYLGPPDSAEDDGPSDEPVAVAIEKAHGPAEPPPAEPPPPPPPPPEDSPPCEVCGSVDSGCLNDDPGRRCPFESARVHPLDLIRGPIPF